MTPPVITRRTALTVFLVLASVGLIVLRSTITYADLPAQDRYARAVGSVLAAWLIGLVVAGIASLVGRRRPGRFRDTMQGATLVLLLILFALTLLGLPDR